MAKNMNMKNIGKLGHESITGEGWQSRIALRLCIGAHEEERMGGVV
jgi:hypothetical protein